MFYNRNECTGEEYSQLSTPSRRGIPTFSSNIWNRDRMEVGATHFAIDIVLELEYHMIYNSAIASGIQNMVGP